jgi:transcriptional regulator with XRE-family HTH domain
MVGQVSGSRNSFNPMRGKKPAPPLPRAPSRKAPDPVDKAVGLRIRARRMAVGVTQEKLADALGVTFQQVQKYEKGTNRVAPSRMVKIAEKLNAPVWSFYGDTKDGVVPVDPVSILCTADQLTRGLIDNIALLFEQCDAEAMKALRITAEAFAERHKQ